MIRLFFSSSGKFNRYIRSRRREKGRGRVKEEEDSSKKKSEARGRGKELRKTALLPTAKYYVINAPARISFSKLYST